MRGQKFRDLDIVPVFFTFACVLNENDRLIGRAPDTVEFPIGTALLDGRYPDRLLLKQRKANPRLAEQRIGAARCRCQCGCHGRFDGSGQYSFVDNFGKQFVHPARRSCHEAGLLRLRLYRGRGQNTR